MWYRHGGPNGKEIQYKIEILQMGPLQVFFDILDLAGINAWILYRETTEEKISRQEFLFQLAVELTATYQESREEEIIPKSPRNINLESHENLSSKIL